MRMAQGLTMGEPTKIANPLLAGAGGVTLGEARTNHQGRKAILMIRNEENSSEFEALVATMGIEIVERINQSGKEDPRSYFGKGRLQDVADELAATVDGHPWKSVDLVLIHNNAAARQLVAVSDAVKVEVWDRVRLLLSLFTSHASSMEARTQVRIAQLQSDRTVLRELVNLQTTGERAGYGSSGATALQAVMENLNREIASLAKRQQRHANAQSERRRQRTRSGAQTVGIAGYTNAGKSSLFLALSGKEVLIEDKLFSTLETTVGRLEASPRVLLADTIGFIDELPNATLEAFRATLSEALECELLLILADASDPPLELERKLFTSRREVFERLFGEDLDDDFPWRNDEMSVKQQIMVVLTKIDKATAHQLEEAKATVAALALPEPILISSHSGKGMQNLKDRILFYLFGPPLHLQILPPENYATERAVAGYVSDLHNAGLVTDYLLLEDGSVDMTIWVSEAEISKLLAKSGARIVIK